MSAGGTRMVGVRKALTLLAWAVVCVCPAVTAADRIAMPGAALEFNAPRKVAAYGYVKVSCTVWGQGEAIVQVVATDRVAHETHFDSALPHRMAFRFECLANDGERVTFRVVNTGDTIWRADGYGRVVPGDFAAPYVYLSSDVAPGGSTTKTYPRDRMLAKSGAQDKLRFVLSFDRSDSSRREQIGSLEVELDDKPGSSARAAVEPGTLATVSEFDELGHTFERIRLDGSRAVTGLTVQVPPWADRLVVRLIKDGRLESATIPISVTRESLRLSGGLTQRWTLDGKPVFILRDIPREAIPQVRAQFGGTNVVLASGAEINPKSEWLEAARRHDLKIIPISLCYIRLQDWVSRVTGYELMPGAPAEFQLQRVDALDPNFPKAMADVVDKVYNSAGDVLYRTADGRIPMCLSEEQSYGYPWASGYPTRWGGSSKEDVTAFRVWLRQKYGSVERLNQAWKTGFGGFNEIDPSPICSITPPEYPDPWREWGRAIEDFDVFRSKIHGEFWAKTIAEIKRRHPDVLCGLNVFGDYASETEPIYEGFFNWGVKDYAGKGVNWMARRTGCLPDDFLSVDFFVCWNTGSPEAAKKNLEFWRKRGKDVIIFPRDYSKVVLGGKQELRTHADLAVGLKGVMVFGRATSFFTTLKATYENGGIGALLNDPFMGEQLTERIRREIELLNQEIALAANP